MAEPVRPPLLSFALATTLAAAAVAVATATLLPAFGGWPRDALLIAAATAASATCTWIYCHRLHRRHEGLRQDVHTQEKTAARREAHRHFARMQAIIETAHAGIVSIDTAGRIDTWNGAAEKMFGYRADEVLGRNVAMLMPEPYSREHDEYIARYLRTGQARVIGIGREVVGLRKDGTEFPVELAIGVGHEAGTQFFTAVLRDLTEVKEMQTKLTQAERLAAVGELAAGVAHEVNNPINTMINCAQLIADGDDAAGNARVILEEGERIAGIVKDLLQFARDDRDRPQATSIAEVVERTLRLMGENFKRHGIRLQIDLPADLPSVKARPQQLQQVLLNLLINAKDALLQPAERTTQRAVHLSAQLVGDGVGIDVVDNGPGVPPQLGNRIFEPFVTTKRARGGTGLGLSISKSIVEGYGGTIDVHSEQGHGATFRVWLPRHHDRAE